MFSSRKKASPRKSESTPGGIVFDASSLLTHDVSKERKFRTKVHRTTLDQDRILTNRIRLTRVTLTPAVPLTLSLTQALTRTKVHRKTLDHNPLDPPNPPNPDPSLTLDPDPNPSPNPH